LHGTSSANNILNNRHIETTLIQETHSDSERYPDTQEALSPNLKDILPSPDIQEVSASRSTQLRIKMDNIIIEKQQK
jgi:hypothetical protein